MNLWVNGRIANFWWTYIKLEIHLRHLYLIGESVFELYCGISWMFQNDCKNDSYMLFFFCCIFWFLIKKWWPLGIHNIIWVRVWASNPHITGWGNWRKQRNSLHLSPNIVDITSKILVGQFQATASLITLVFGLLLPMIQGLCPVCVYNISGWVSSWRHIPVHPWVIYFFCDYLTTDSRSRHERSCDSDQLYLISSENI